MCMHVMSYATPTLCLSGVEVSPRDNVSGFRDKTTAAIVVTAQVELKEGRGVRLP